MRGGVGLDRLDPAGLDRLDPAGLDRLDPAGDPRRARKQRVENGGGREGADYAKLPNTRHHARKDNVPKVGLRSVRSGTKPFGTVCS